MSDRFPLLAYPVALPGQCWLDGNTTGPFVDTGQSAEDYGAVILCRNCVLELAETVGCLRPELAEAERALRRDAEEQVAATRARLAGLQTVADALARWHRIEEGDGGVPAGDAGDGGGDAGGGRRGRAGGGAADGDGGGKVRPAAAGAGR